MNRRDLPSHLNRMDFDFISSVVLAYSQSRSTHFSFFKTFCRSIYLVIPHCRKFQQSYLFNALGTIAFCAQGKISLMRFLGGYENIISALIKTEIMHSIKMDFPNWSLFLFFFVTFLEATNILPVMSGSTRLHTRISWRKLIGHF